MLATFGPVAVIPIEPRYPHMTIIHYCLHKCNVPQWQENDFMDFVDWNQARLKSLANERDVPYQSLIKTILAEHLAKR